MASSRSMPMASATSVLLYAVVLLSTCSAQQSTEHLCKVTTGKSLMIMDMPESRGAEVSQKMTPEFMPISGTPEEDIRLKIVNDNDPGKKYFTINGKRLQLLQPLDRDATGMTNAVFHISCTILSTGQQVIIPTLIRISDINDNAPEFVGTPYEAEVAELSPVGHTVFRGIRATDPDDSVNGQVDYFVVPMPDDPLDGSGHFTVLPSVGNVVVNHSLDYERQQTYHLRIIARDRAEDVRDRFTTTTTMTIHVKDSDDMDPTFRYPDCTEVDGRCVSPEYRAEVTSGVLTGVVDTYPARILAEDMDSLNSRIHYSFLQGTPNSYNEYFRIDSRTGQLEQIKPIDRSVARHFDLIVKAEEETEARRYATAKLMIDVLAVDANPPEIQVSSIVGYARENSPVGTVVMATQNLRNPITLQVFDKDLTAGDPILSYRFELTTTAFAVNTQGVLVVNEPNLDREGPNNGRYSFQLLAREIGGDAASSPVSMVVHLLDVNDNAPVLPMYPQVTIQAGDGRRNILRVQAKDDDAGENAEIKYSIYHVSNNGRSKFDINETTGDFQVIRRVNAGEQFSVTVQATDRGGKFSQSIVEVIITPGPNRAGPVFPTELYDVRVSEGAAPGTTVLSLNANDPENDRVSYAIIKGNERNHFSISGDTGDILVNSNLDRESLSRYSLLVKAEDPQGLSSTATVDIKVMDINDKNPIFTHLPYEFEISEGKTDAYIGTVKAVDDDLHENAIVVYAVPENSPFGIDRETGDIYTKKALDYETEKVHYVVVTAKDMAPDPRISTATVTVHVRDIPDEPPVFKKTLYEATVPENRANLDVVKVEAFDPDNEAGITYTILKGSERFIIDPRTGLIRTHQELDFEKEETHRIIVGTRENIADSPNASATVIVHVQDVNDIPPSFNLVPLPVKLKDTDSIGTVIGSVMATDGDGTSPNNQVSYEVVGAGKAAQYFMASRNTGEITLKDDLRKERDTEYKVVVRAYDSGEPLLASTATVTVFVEHLVTIPPEAGVGFAETEHSVEVPENSPKGYLVKRISVVNRPPVGAPFSCSILSGNERDHFYVVTTDDLDCEVRLKAAQIDYEWIPKYDITIGIDTLSGYLNDRRREARIMIKVTDENDNAPEFIFPQIGYGLTGQKFFAAISEDAQIGTSIAYIHAKDADSGPNGDLRFELTHESNLAGYFSMSKEAGIIRNEKTLLQVPSHELPFKLSVRVYDNPTKPEDSKNATAPVIVNIIGPETRMILVVENAVPEEIKAQENTLIRTLEEQSGFIVGIEKVGPRHFITANNTMEMDQTGTDVSFYAIHPRTGKILRQNDTRLINKLTGPNAQSSVIYFINGNLHVRAREIRAPLKLEEVRHVNVTKTSIQDLDGFAALIVLAFIIFILVFIIAVIYICCILKRHSKDKEDMRNSFMITTPFEPVHHDTAPSKQYEVQTLNMNCMDADDPEPAPAPERRMDIFTINQNLNLHEVDYITKDHTRLKGNPYLVNSDETISSGPTNSAGSDASSSEGSSKRSSTRGRRRNGETKIKRDFHEEISVERGGEPKYRRTRDVHRETVLYDDSGFNESPAYRNPAYDGSSDEGGPMSMSVSNENVMFRGRRELNEKLRSAAAVAYPYVNERSPIDSTTEL